MKRICLIGSGNVAEAFAVALGGLHPAGRFRLGQIYARNRARGAKLARMAGCRPYGRSGTACPGRYLPDFGQRHTNRGSSGKPRFRQRHCRAHSRERLAERLARPLVPPGGVLPAANVYGREADRFPAGSAADRRGTSGHGRGTALTCLGTIRFGIRSFGTAARATPPGRGFRMQLYQPHVCDRTRVARRKGPAAAVDRPVDL